MSDSELLLKGKRQMLRENDAFDKSCVVTKRGGYICLLTAWDDIEGRTFEEYLKYQAEIYKELTGR